MNATSSGLEGHDPYAAPSARIEELPTTELVLADRGSRLLATIIDGLMIAGLAMVVGFVGAFGAGSAGNPESVAMMVGVLAVLGGVVVVAINCVLLHRHGQTIGKRWLGIRILRSDGSHCSLLRVIFARWLPVTVLGVIPLLGYIVQLVDPLFIFRSDYRCIHDHIADTIVVRA